MQIPAVARRLCREKSQMILVYINMEFEKEKTGKWTSYFVKKGAAVRIMIFPDLDGQSLVPLPDHFPGPVLDILRNNCGSSYR